MKNEYVSVKIEIIRFDTEDIITKSPIDELGDENNG